jgi:transcriptional regulator with XRE-family HTH domain
MPIVNIQTYEKRRKKLRLTAKEIAFRAQVTETTVGKIKKGKNLQNYPVEKIAGVLSMTVEQITSPPEEDISNEKENKFYNDDDLIAASILYNVPASWILEHAALFFQILAEQMFLQRTIKVKQLEKEFEALDSQMPYKDDLIDGWKEFYLEGINEELRAISRKDLSGPRDAKRSQNAKFINFLRETGEDLLGDFEIYDAFQWDAKSKLEIEQGAELSNISYRSELRLEASSRLLSTLLEAGCDRASEAEDIIDSQYLLSKIPIRLRTPDRAEELVDWVLQWRDGAYDALLSETQDEEKNQKRALVKAALKKDATWQFDSIYRELNEGPIDKVVEAFIKRNLINSELSDANNLNSWDGESSDA